MVGRYKKVRMVTAPIRYAGYRFNRKVVAYLVCRQRFKFSILENIKTKHQ